MAARRNNKRLAEIAAELADSEDDTVVSTRGRAAASRKPAATSRKAYSSRNLKPVIKVEELSDSEAEEEAEEQEEEPVVSTRGRASSSRNVKKKVHELFDSEAEEALDDEEEEVDEEEEEGEEEEEEEEPVVSTRNRAAPSRKRDAALKSNGDDDEYEQIARGQALGIIAPDMATATAVADAVQEEANAKRSSVKGSGSSSLSSPGDSGTSGRKALWNKKKSPGEGGGSASRLAPSSGGNRRRITRMFTTIVRDPGTHLLLAVFVSNAYDRAQFLNGTLDYEGGNAKARMVKFPMRLFYTNARNTRCVFSSLIITFCQSLPTYYIHRFANFPCESPPCLRNHYPTYVAIGFDEDEAVTEANSAKLQALIDQFKAVVDGSEDLSNNATFSVVTTDVDADDNMLQALVALSE
jgi:hypothetical protein